MALHHGVEGVQPGSYRVYVNVAKWESRYYLQGLCSIAHRSDSIDRHGTFTEAAIKWRSAAKQKPCIYGYYYI
jgi:hypothetical protein